MIIENDYWTNYICDILHVSENDIKEVMISKKGMTNRTYSFSCTGEKYFVRIPGEGTDCLINRRNEASVYKAINGLGICDDPLHIDSETGCKVAKFVSNFRNPDPYDINDVKICMSKLKDFHEMKLKVSHKFDIFEQILFYESLILQKGRNSKHWDYEQIKCAVFSLRDYIYNNVFCYALTHVDSVPDNFLICENNNGENIVQLTDWEYSGMQDPHLDIAMWCIYSMYDLEWIDNTINLYFNGFVEDNLRTKIYCYIAAGGLLWSNWCEYKSLYGVHFGSYEEKQFYYAKIFSRIARERMLEGR